MLHTSSTLFSGSFKILFVPLAKHKKETYSQQDKEKKCQGVLESSHYKLNLDLKVTHSVSTARKSILKLMTYRLRNAVKYEKYSLAKFIYVCYRM